jgi:hypothetical protein
LNVAVESISNLQKHKIRIQLRKDGNNSAYIVPDRALAEHVISLSAPAVPRAGEIFHERKTSSAPSGGFFFVVVRNVERFFVLFPPYLAKVYK